MIKATGTQVSFNGNHFDKNCIGNTAYYAFELLVGNGTEDTTVTDGSVAAGCSPRRQSVST
jgi:hypothetical protein